jgi:DNA-binding CsgD family transcriptional regulator
VLGFIALSLGDLDAAVSELRLADRHYRELDLREPGQYWQLPDLLDALVAAGELDEAESLVAPWEERALALDRAWALAIAGRARALLAAARGDLDGAFGLFERAVAEHERSQDPFQHARTQLALGATQRRAKQRGKARGTLERSLATYEQLGAPLWADQARAELARIGGRTSSGDELTEAERRIAELVAAGHTNRETAAALFVTVHTVEAALTRTYRKLGIRSRSELARRLAEHA